MTSISPRQGQGPQAVFDEALALEAELGKVSADDTKGVQDLLEKIEKCYTTVKDMAANPQMRELRGHAQNNLGLFKIRSGLYTEAVALFKAADKNGCPDAAVNLGKCYEEGWGVEPDNNKARIYFVKAMASDSTEGLVGLARCCWHGIGSGQDKESALEYLKLAANKDHIEAQRALETMQNDLTDTEAPPAMASNDKSQKLKKPRPLAQKVPTPAQLLDQMDSAAPKVEKSNVKKPANNEMRLPSGVQAAINMLGDANSNATALLENPWDLGMVAVGRDVSEIPKLKLILQMLFKHKNEEHCLRGWIALAVYCSHLSAMPQVVTKLKDMVKKGDPWAMRYLGACYENGLGVDKDLKEAFKLYQEAATRGLSAACDDVAWCYSRGIGVAKNNEEEVQWYLEGVKRGSKTAVHNLAKCYENGQGTPKNLQEAEKYYRRAIELGVNQARCDLGGLYLQGGDGFPADPKKAILLFKKAWNGGCEMAASYLGYCYRNSKGVAENFQEAVRWYVLGAEKGELTAIYNLGVCYEDGTGIQKDLAKARECYVLAASQGYNLAIERLAELDKDLANGALSVSSEDKKA